MQKSRQLLVVSLLTLTLGVSVASCGSSSSADTTVTAAAVAPVRSTIIDVRTAAEFATGHVEGAVNIDLSNGDLAAALGGMDKSAAYVLYCRSGNRSGQALSLMEQQGFTNVKNLGSLEQAAEALGTQIVTE